MKEAERRSCCSCGFVVALTEFPRGSRKDGTAAYCKRCTNEYKRKWYAAHRAEEVARCAAYNKRKPEVARSAMRKYRKTKPEQYKAARKRWVSANRSRIAMYDAKKRAVRRNAIGCSTVTVAQWDNIKRKHRYKCAYCGKRKKLTMDHIQPLSRGGKHAVENIAPACLSCNARKCATDATEFSQRFLGKLL